MAIYIEMAPERKVKIAVKGRSISSCLYHSESPSNQVPSEYKSLVQIYGINDVPLFNHLNPNYSPNTNNSLTNKERVCLSGSFVARLLFFCSSRWSAIRRKGISNSQTKVSSIGR
jgi:hypothetical protein